MKLSTLDIDRGIFDAIRYQVEEVFGYFPNRKLYTGTNDPAFIAAATAIKDSGKPLIWVVSDGDYKQRRQLMDHSIIINRETPQPSIFGTVASPVYTPAPNDKFAKTLTASTRYDIPYNIRYITSGDIAAEVAAVIEEILAIAVGSKKMITALAKDRTEKGSFVFLQNNSFDLSDTEFVERGFLFRAMNIDLVGATDEGLVAATTSIEIGMHPTDEPTNSADVPPADEFIEIEFSE